MERQCTGGVVILMVVAFAFSRSQSEQQTRRFGRRTLRNLGQIPGIRPRFMNASGTFTLTETVTPTLADTLNNQLSLAATGHVTGAVSGVSRDGRDHQVSNIDESNLLTDVFRAGRTREEFGGHASADAGRLHALQR
jgi:hypothetical protein